jgi:hypothetical protein
MHEQECLRAFPTPTPYSRLRVHLPCSRKFFCCCVCRHVSWFRLQCTTLVSQGLFGLLITCAIFANTAILAMDHYGMSMCVSFDCIAFSIACCGYCDLMLRKRTSTLRVKHASTDFGNCNNSLCEKDWRCRVSPPGRSRRSDLCAAAQVL